jgi:hypothetical protein
MSDPNISQVSALGFLLRPMSQLELRVLANAKIAIVAMRWRMKLKADSDHLMKGGGTRYSLQAFGMAAPRRRWTLKPRKPIPSLGLVARLVVPKCK